MFLLERFLLKQLKNSLKLIACVNNEMFFLNNQDSFAVKIPRVRLLKINHVIWAFAQHMLFTCCKTHGSKMAESSTNSVPAWICESKWFFWVSTLAKVIIYHSIGLFDAHIDMKFSRLQNKFGVWVSCATLCDVFVWCFEMEVQPFVRFFEQRVYNCWNWFILWWRTIGRENKQIPDFFLTRLRILLISGEDVC